MFASPVNVKRDLTIEEVARLEENGFRLPGVHVRVDPVRHYPETQPLLPRARPHRRGQRRGTQARHLAAPARLRRPRRHRGAVRKAAARPRRERVRRGRRPGPGNRPHPGQAARARGAGQRPGPDARRPDPAARLPAARTLPARRRGRHGGPGPAPSSASSRGPDFDPNIFMAPISPSTWDSLVGNPSKPFFNRAITSSYPPGSTMKPVDRPGRAPPGRGRRPRPGSSPATVPTSTATASSSARRPHGSLDLVGAIAQSCNVYFYQLGLRLGLDSLTAYARGNRAGQR